MTSFIYTAAREAHSVAKKVVSVFLAAKPDDQFFSVAVRLSVREWIKTEGVKNPTSKTLESTHLNKTLERIIHQNLPDYLDLAIKDLERTANAAFLAAEGPLQAELDALRALRKSLETANVEPE